MNKAPNYFTNRCRGHEPDPDDSFEGAGWSSIEQDTTMEMAQTHFLNLAGLDLDYYGCDEADNTFKVDDIVFKVLEDPDDGYRSYLGTVDYTRDHRDRPRAIFFSQPVAKVKIVPFVIDPETDVSLGSRGEIKGYQLIDSADGHCWLEIGTDYKDDYYPCFIFRHSPKEENIV